MICINTNSREYQWLKRATGTPEFLLNAISRSYMEKYNRFPYVDEIPNASTEKFLRKELGLESKNSTTIDKLLEYTDTQTPEDAMVKLNDMHRDLLVKVLPLGETALVLIEKKPTSLPTDSSETIEQNASNNFVVLGDILTKLSDYLNVQIIPVDNETIMSDENLNGLVDATSAKAFVYNGDIYLNLDNASIDSPLHEMLHLVFGSMKYTNPELYVQTVEQAQYFKYYNEMAKSYPNRTQNDLNEEIFITELAKHLSGKTSALDNLDETIMHEIAYNTNRVLDTALMGSFSVKSIQNPYELSLKQISSMVNSSVMHNTFQGSLTDARFNRLVANKKEEMFKNKELKEICQ